MLFTSLQALLFTSSFASFVHSSPIQHEERAGSSLPTITLPYGVFRAARYNSVSDIYTFKNIPYAAPPVGDLRWRKPEPPLNKSGIQDGSYGFNCPQAGFKGINILGPGNKSKLGQAINQFIAGIPLPDFGGTSEDCLFLDLYVPAKALKLGAQKLPVAVFIFGGGFVLGSKDVYQPALPFYDGTGLLGQSGNSMIFASINYRLGAFGFLAGNTMESDGLPNAGLWDQRAAFQWVRDYISLFGGDANRVTAMGESAGAGSILHHLVAQGGTLDPLFQRAILLSPAYQPMWDRAGGLEDMFQTFANLAGCGGKGLSCLRAASADVLAKANGALAEMVTPGSFAVGPAPDGAFIRQLPVLELSAGNVWPIESLLLSHCAKESTLFVSGQVNTNDQFSAFVSGIFPPYTTSAGINAKVTAFYPPVGVAGVSSPYKSQTERMEAFIRDSSMTCNVRWLNEALGDDKVYNMQYSVAPGWHAADLFAVFYNSRISSNSWAQILSTWVLVPLGILYTGISTALQSYLASYVITGDPNRNRVVLNLPPTISWNHPNSKGEQVTGVVNVGNLYYSTISDDQNPKSACDFWRQFSSAVTGVGGYSPPGSSVVAQSLAEVKDDRSRNFVGGNGGKS